MILKALLASILIVWSALAQTNDSKSEPETVSAPDEMQQAESPTEDIDVLSTELDGIDTLNVLPTDVITPYQGGTRRVHLESTVFRREEPLAYNSIGRRDPFRALIVDEKKEGEVQTDLLIVDGAVLTGIVWAEGHYLAMIRDKDSRTFFLREGDPVYSGRVTAVTQTHIVVDISSFGEYHQVTLKVNG